MEHKRRGLTGAGGNTMWMCGCLLALLAFEGCLLLSEHFRWLPFNEHKGWSALIAVAVPVVAMLLMLVCFAVCPPFRQRFRLSIRSLLILVLVLAIPCSWLAVELKKARAQSEVVEEIRRLGGVVRYDYEFYGSSGGPEPRGPLFAWKLLGDDFFNNPVAVGVDDDAQMERLNELPQLQWLLDTTHLTYHEFGPSPRSERTRITDCGLRHLDALTQLEVVQLDGTQITDGGLRHLGALTQLLVLNLDKTRITDEGLQHLEGLTQLVHLNLGSTQVKGPGLQHLRGMAELTSLDLSGTQISDARLEHLKNLTQLRWVNLHDTQVTDEGMQKLQYLLPDCELEMRAGKRTPWDEGREDGSNAAMCE